jgi:hypothetical protein
MSARPAVPINDAPRSVSERTAQSGLDLPVFDDPFRAIGGDLDHGRAVMAFMPGGTTTWVGRSRVDGRSTNAQVSRRASAR